MLMILLWKWVWPVLFAGKSTLLHCNCVCASVCLVLSVYSLVNAICRFCSGNRLSTYAKLVHLSILYEQEWLLEN